MGCLEVHNNYNDKKKILIVLIIMMRIIIIMSDSKWIVCNKRFYSYFGWNSLNELSRLDIHKVYYYKARREGKYQHKN